MKERSLISLMSAPAAKAFSDPVMSMQPILAIGLEAVDGVAQFADQLGIQRVEHLRPVQRDQADRPARLGGDGFVGH